MSIPSLNNSRGKTRKEHDHSFYFRVQLPKDVRNPNAGILYKLISDQMMANNYSNRGKPAFSRKIDFTKILNDIDEKLCLSN